MRRITALSQACVGTSGAGGPDEFLRCVPFSALRSLQDQLINYQQIPQEIFAVKIHWLVRHWVHAPVRRLAGKSKVGIESLL